MSHNRIVKMQIRNANKAVITSAMQMLAAELKQLGLTEVKVVEKIPQFTAPDMKVEMGVVYRGRSNQMVGFGVVIKRDGSLECIGDEYFSTKLGLDDFNKKLMKHYKAAGYIMALRQMGYQTQAQVRQGKVVTVGVIQ